MLILKKQKNGISKKGIIFLFKYFDVNIFAGLNTGYLKIDATHWYDNDVLL